MLRRRKAMWRHRGRSEAATFRFCFDACTMQVKMYAATAAALRSINGTSLRFFLGLQLNNITSLAIDLRLRARPVKKVTVTCFVLIQFESEMNL